MMNIVERLRHNNDKLLMRGHDYSDVVLDAADEITRLRAELAAREWQPIKTVPKDGDDVIFLNVDRMLVLNMSPSHFWKTRTHPAHIRFEATHWMPLPTPPQPEK